MSDDKKQPEGKKQPLPPPPNLNKTADGPGNKPITNIIKSEK